MQRARFALITFLVAVFWLTILPARQSGSLHRWYHDENQMQWWVCQEEQRSFADRRLPRGAVEFHHPGSWQEIERLHSLVPPPYREETSGRDCIDAMPGDLR